MQKLGLEMEMVVARRDTGRSHAVTTYFDALARRKRARGLDPVVSRVGGRAVAVVAQGGESGLDNGFNHLESALGPVQGGPGGLARLQALVEVELADVIDALAEEGAILLNASQHPYCPLDETFYRTMRAPKAIYDDWVEHRGWQHRIGIDAKAQNGPTTSVPLAQAASALNVVLALAPASIALFANSPLEAGVDTGLQENRLTIWPRMFAQARFAADRRLSRLPRAPFADLGAYFRWAYGGDSVMQTLPSRGSRDYKGDPHAVRVEGLPSLLDFLRGGPRPATVCDTGERVLLAPAASHFEHAQFAPFLDARFRFRFGRPPMLPALLTALETTGGLESLMAEHDTDAYIEGRMPGANLPDAGLLAELGSERAASVVMAPAALQAGLLARLDDAERLVRDWGWARLRDLREKAIVHALHDAEVHRLAGEVLALARTGLDADDLPRLAYAEWVWRHRRTGADRMLDIWRSGPRPMDARLAALAAARMVVHPREWVPVRSAA